tara:strand:- start:161 stop:517 length:357 start_codon:yes stop_codon:yes gene_type:complete
VEEQVLDTNLQEQLADLVVADLVVDLELLKQVRQEIHLQSVHLKEIQEEPELLMQLTLHLVVVVVLQLQAVLFLVQVLQEDQVVQEQQQVLMELQLLLLVVVVDQVGLHQVHLLEMVG